MKRLSLAALVALFVTAASYSQTERAWNAVSKTSSKTSAHINRISFPSEYTLSELNLENMKSALQDVKAKTNKNKAGKIVYFPNSEGALERFEVFEYSNFSPELQAQFPEIKSYTGIGVDDKYAKIRFSVDPSGIQAMVFRTGKRNEFIEPFTEDGKVYAIYNSSRTKGNLPFTCSTVDHAIAGELNREAQPRLSSSGELLTFRLALSCNGEYTQYFGGTVAGALAAMNATMTRVNGVFEKDLAIHMNLIANNTAVIYTNAATDPYTTMGNWNGQLQTTLTNIIGEANYDIGHMFGATGGGGNAGCIGCVCQTGKGSGITSPADGVPMGDNFDIDYVAHEMGHQFGGNHTFSHNVEGSGVNVEPGSGSTIMGYAGITNRDVQPHSDDYFVYASIKQIQDNMVGKTCPVRTPLDNHTPVVDAGLDYTIPKSTPFMLTGTATDADGDALSYCWEQNDSATTQSGAASAASATKTGGPNWRSFDPVTSPVRYCPILPRVIANQTTTQGTEIAVEALSSVARKLNFVLTVRDNVAGAGQTVSDGMEITVNAVAGPFQVTEPNTNISWQVGSNQTVTWNVAGTTGNNVNAAFVDIYLSTDGGNTYPILLASQVPNDGSEIITVPDNVGTTNRVMIKGYKHIFYDISNTNFAITAPVSDFAASFVRIGGQQNKENCTGGDISFAITYSAYSGFSGTTTFAVTGQPAGTSVVFSPASINAPGEVTMTISNTLSATPGFYSMLVTATSGAVSKTVPLYFQLFDSNFGTVSLTSPANLAVGQNVTTNLVWAADANATSYDLEVATDNAFTNIVTAVTVTANNYLLTGLSEATDYYWRILPKNTSCGGSFSPASTFETGVVTCNDFTSANVPVTIPTTANATVNSTLNVTDNFILSDVNVNVAINHTWVNDLTVTLISPAGTQIQLVANACGDDVENINATFDDSGVSLVCGTNPAISGNIKPVQLLSTLNGQSSAGNWTLRVLDSFAQDGGSITGWSLNLCNTQPNLATPETSIHNFVLYPNPTSGLFHLEFNSASGNDITVGVHDIRGREIYKKVYPNSGLFNEQIQLDNAQSGVYFVTVQDGNSKVVKRIIKN